jgi:hypothetical protein
MGTTQPRTDEGAPNRTDLDGRYREIGIPAVAAAVRYQSDRKNPAYSPIPAEARFAVDAAA